VFKHCCQAVLVPEQEGKEESAFLSSKKEKETT